MSRPLTLRHNKKSGSLRSDFLGHQGGNPILDMSDAAVAYRLNNRVQYEGSSDWIFVGYRKRDEGKLHEYERPVVMARVEPITNRYIQHAVPRTNQSALHNPGSAFLGIRFEADIPDEAVDFVGPFVGGPRLLRHLYVRMRGQMPFRWEVTHRARLRGQIHKNTWVNEFLPALDRAIVGLAKVSAYHKEFEKALHPDSQEETSEIPNPRWLDEMITLLDGLEYNVKEQYKPDEPRDRPEYAWWTDLMQRDLVRLEFEVEHTLLHRARFFMGHATHPEYRLLLEQAAMFVHEFVERYRLRRPLQGRGHHEYPRSGRDGKPPVDAREPREITVPGLELPDPQHIQRVQWKSELDDMIEKFTTMRGHIFEVFFTAESGWDDAQFAATFGIPLEGYHDQTPTPSALMASFLGAAMDLLRCVQEGLPKADRSGNTINENYPQDWVEEVMLNMHQLELVGIPHFASLLLRLTTTGRAADSRWRIVFNNFYRLAIRILGHLHKRFRENFEFTIPEELEPKGAHMLGASTGASFDAMHSEDVFVDMRALSIRIYRVRCELAGVEAGYYDEQEFQEALLADPDTAMQYDN